MLENLDDPDSIGPGMPQHWSRPFTVDPGNLVFTPIAKMKAQSELGDVQKELYIEGLLSIQEGETRASFRTAYRVHRAA